MVYSVLKVKPEGTSSVMGSQHIPIAPFFEPRSAGRPAIVGRSVELGELVERASTPVSASLLVGEHSSGRTRLLEEVRDSVPVRYVWVGIHPAEHAQAFSGLLRLLEAVGDARVVEGAEALVSRKPDDADPVAIASRVLTLLRERRREELLVLVDDAERLDDQSRIAVGHMAARLAGTRIRLVLACTPGVAESSFAGIRRVQLARLSDELQHELAEALAPLGSDEQTLRMIARACSGLPGVMRATLEHLTVDQLTGLAPLPLPPYLDDVERLELGWDAQTTRIMKWMSAAPLTSIPALMNAHDVSKAHIEQLVFQGDADVRGPFIFIRDNALRARLYWSMTFDERMDLHARAASAEAEQCAALALWHSDHLDGSHAAVTSAMSLVTEATALFGAGYTEAAIEMTERALMLGLGDEKTLDELLALCCRLLSLSELHLAQRYLTMHGRAAATPNQVAASLTASVTLQALTGNDIDVMAIRSFAHHYIDSKPQECAELLSFAALFHASRGELANASSFLDEASAIVADENISRYGTQYWSKRLVDAIVGAEFEPVDGDDDDLDEFQRLVPCLQIASARALSLEERYSDSRRCFAAISAHIPSAEHDSAWAARVVSLAAENEILAGQVTQAIDLVSTLADLGAPRTLKDLVLFSWKALMTGDTASADGHVREAATQALWSSHSLDAAKFTALQGTFALARGNLDEAHYRLSRAYEAALAVRPDYLRMEGDFVEVLALQGDGERARSVCTRFSERAARHPSAWSRVVLARCRAILAQDANLISEFQDALALAISEDAFLEAARTRLAFSTALQRAGAISRSVEQGRAALHQFEAMSATAWAQAAAAASTPVAPQRSDNPLSTLTEHELAVLRLMQAGRRNKEIAAALFVSLRTVEVRITQIYRKLDARSRSHLLTLLPGDLDQVEVL